MKIDIQNAITKAMKARNERVQVDADYVLERLIEIDSLDVIDILDENGDLLAISQWPKAWRTNIRAVDVNEINSGDTTTIIKKIKFPDKVKNLELLGKHTDVQAWKNKIEHSGEMTVHNLIAEISASNAEINISPLPKDNV